MAEPTLRVEVVDQLGQVADPDYKFTIEGKPLAVNACFKPHLIPRGGKGPKGYRASIGRTKAYERARATLNVPCPRTQHLLIVRIDAYWDRRSRQWSTETVDVPVADADAVLKPLLDSMQFRGVFEDDIQILRLLAAKHYDKTNPRTEVRIWEL